MKAYNLNEEETQQRKDDYARGKRDCDNGIRSRENESDSYYMGYGEQYAHEQILTHFSEK